MRHDDSSRLVLVRADKSRQGGPWSDNDYDVWDGAGKVVGRVFRAPMAPRDRPWFWTITVRAPQRPTERGYAPTREDAMSVLKEAWRHLAGGRAGPA